MVEKIRVVLADKYDLVVGDTFQLFYRSVIEAPNPYRYSIVVKCKKGKSFPRYYEYTPTEPGTYKLTMQVVDADFTVLGSAETTINVVVPKKPEKPVNILCIGDSLTQGGAWVTELNRRIVANDGVPAGLGFQDAVKFHGRPTKAGTPCEGYGGWHWESFLINKPGAMWVKYDNNISQENQHSLWKDHNGAIWQLETLQVDYLKFNRYMDHDSPFPTEPPLVHYQNATNTDPIYFESCSPCGSSPFFDHDKGCVDFASYAKKHNIDTIDAVYVMLGRNGRMSQIAQTLSQRDYCKHVVSVAKQLITKLKEAFPDVKVRILGLPGHSLNGGMGTSYGCRDSYELTSYEMDLDEEYQAWCNEDGWKDFVEYVDLAGQFDAEYNLPSKQKVVNTRCQTTEVLGTNGVHPALSGYMQIADAVYRNLVASFMHE